MRRAVAVAVALSALAAAAQVPAGAAQVYRVGAAVREIHPGAPGSPFAPDMLVRKGGSGLGDGSVIPSQVIGPGGLSRFEGERIAARALVVDDGATAVALVTVETQGMFAAYQRGIPGLVEIAERASAEIAAAGGSLPAASIVISNDHTHSGPDLIGAWGFVPDEYARWIGDQTVAAIVAAYGAREEATITAGADWAPDIIYNQTCTEALNQSRTATFPNTICTPTQDRKDAWVRVLQARSAADPDRVIATAMAYAAHATLGGGAGLHGDWPQFMSDRLSGDYGGVGIAFEGAVGRTQPCRPVCSFTDPQKPGYPTDLDNIKRKPVYTDMLSYHVARALTGAPAVSGSVAASKATIRHEVTNAGLFALTTNGGLVGAPIARSLDKPWVVGNTVLTLTSAVRIGTLLVNGAPGEAYPNIPAGVEEALNVPAQRHWTLGLADDQLGYLIAPAEAYPLIAAQSPVNDNAFFNVSPTIGDHVMCAQIRLSVAVGFPLVRTDPHCPAWDAYDAAGDPLGR